MLNLRIKASVAEHWRLGAFGNCMRTWDNPCEVPQSARSGSKFSLRALQPGGRFLPNLKFPDVWYFWHEGYYICESLDNLDLIVQGELQRVPTGYQFTNSFELITQREALTRTDGSVKHVTGSLPWYYLKAVMTPNSWEELSECFNQFPDAIVELSVYNRELGSNPGCNTIIWEVREF